MKINVDGFRVEEIVLDLTHENNQQKIERFEFMASTMGKGFPLLYLFLEART